MSNEDTRRGPPHDTVVCNTKTLAVGAVHVADNAVAGVASVAIVHTVTVLVSLNAVGLLFCVCTHSFFSLYTLTHIYWTITDNGPTEYRGISNVRPTH